MSVWHLLWIIPISVMVGYVMCGLLSMNDR